MKPAKGPTDYTMFDASASGKSTFSLEFCKTSVGAVGKERVRFLIKGIFRKKNP